jgi:PIN like domain
VTVFLDRCLGMQVVRGLRDAGHDVVGFHEIYPHSKDGTHDDKWIPEVGARGWTILTQDQAIYRTSVEFDALYDTRVKFFMVTQKKLNAHTTLLLLARVWERIETICAEVDGPFVYRIRLDGTIHRKDTPAGWKRVLRLRAALPEAQGGTG